MPEHTVQALIMRVTPQANITDGTGTTIPAKSAAEARKVLARTARLQGGPITVKQHGYDPADPAAGTILAIHTNGQVDDHDDTGPGPRWDVGYHSWVIDVEHEGSYNVPGVPTALGDAQMLANRLDRPVIVHVEDIKPDTSNNPHTLVEPQPQDAGMERAADDVPAQNNPARNNPDLDEANRDATEQDAVELEGAVTEAEFSNLGVPGRDPAAEPGWDPDPEPAVMLPQALDDGGAGRPDPETGVEDLLPGPAGDSDREDDAPAPPAPTKRRRRVLLAALVALVLLAGGAAATTVLDALAPNPPSPAGAGAVPVSWQATAVPGDVVLADHGVLVSAAPGKAEVFSLTDGKPLGGGALPEGRVRVVSGTDAVFAIVTSADGTNTGFAATPAGVKDLKGVKGTLVARGAEPFFLTGSGRDQAALVWDGTAWKSVQAPEPGMAPVAASKAGVLWLGTNSRLVRGTTSAALQAPEAAAKISSWVWADDKSVGLLWDTGKGPVLAVHAIADGKITGQVPAPNAEIRKDGDVLLAGTRAFTIDSGVPVAAECADPVPAGGRLWCRSDNTWAADNARPLAPGQTPVPSPEDVVVTATDKGFTASPGDAMKNDQTQEEK